jgi:predicted nuclease of predicted toxin-antitoxin system
MPAFVIDEDMPRSTGRILQERGYAVSDIRDYDLRGANDDVIYQFAQDKQAVFITADLGFSNILRYPIGSHFGIVIARFPSEMSTKEINVQLVEQLKSLTDQDFKGNLVIIEPGNIRVRKRQY